MIRVENIRSFIPIANTDSEKGWVQKIAIPVVESQVWTGQLTFRYLGFEPLNIRAGAWPAESDETLQNRIRTQMIARLQTGENRLKTDDPALNTNEEVRILSEYFTL